MSKKVQPDMTNALILNQDKHALLIHNIKNGQNRWEFVGGKLKPEDKNLEECVIREVLEEIGCKIKIIKRDGKKILGDYETTTPEGDFKCRTYHAKIIEGEPEIIESDKADDLKYFNYNELLYLHEQKILAPNLVLALPKSRTYVR